MERADPEGEAEGRRGVPPATPATPAALWAVAALALGLWLWIALPLALGSRTFYFRDVFATHLPQKAFGAAELAAGRVPAFNPAWGLGQPFRGNPNALAFYLGNVLYLALPFWSAFNLHYALHWLLAALAMRALARALGQGRAAALAAGLTYAGSGWVMSGLSFYNLLAVSAWWPLALWGAVRGGRRGVALGGAACGMALLGGEPVTAALGTVPLLLAATAGRSLRRALGLAAGIGGLGLLVALPQLVATARVLPFTFRGAYGTLAGPGDYTVAPWRLAELLVPFPRGVPWDLGPQGFAGAEPPYVLTLGFGAVGLWLAVLGARRSWRWTALAAAGFLFAWAAGLGGDALLALSRGLARYPEKLLFWTALAAPLLAGWGVERALAGQRSWRGAAAFSLGTLAAAVAVLATGPALGSWIAGAMRSDAHPGAPRGLVALWVLSLGVAALSLAAAAVAARRSAGRPVSASETGRADGVSGAGIVFAQLLALLPLGGLAATAPVEPFAAPAPWARALPPGAAVVSSTAASPFGNSRPAYRLEDTSYRAQVELSALDLDPAPGVLHGLTYPLAPDLDGMHSPLSSLLLLNLPGIDWHERAAWLRALGVTAAVLDEDPRTPRLVPVAAAPRAGTTSVLALVRAPAPAAWWPREVAAAESPAEAFRAVSVADDPVGRVVASRPVEHRPGGRVARVVEESDRLEVDVESPGGLLVLRRAYQPLYHATSGGAELETLPVNLTLLGVVVPPGRRRVVVAVPPGPEPAAAAAGGAVLAATLAAGFWPARRRAEGAAS